MITRRASGLSLLLGSIGFSYAQANPVTYSFITCAYQGSGSWAGCSVTPHEYLRGQRYERTVTFNYTFSCSPGSETKFAIGAKSQDKWVPFQFGKSGTVSFDTQYGVAIANQTEKSFYNANFNPGCNLVVETTESGPTQNQLDIWQRDAAHYEALVTSEEKLQSQLKTLSTLNAAFDILMVLVSHLDNSLRQQAGVIEKIKSGETTSALQQIADSSPDAERARALRLLIKEIERIRVDDLSDDVLSRSLSPEELAKVRGVSRPDPDEIRTSLEASIARDHSYFNTFASICIPSKSFISIPSCVARGPWPW